MVRINVLKPSGIDVITSSEKDTSIDIRPTVGVKITNNRLKNHVFDLTARENLSGDIMIYDHKDIDIVLMKEKKKIVAFAKDILTDNVYGAESRLFEYLKRHGIVAYDSIQGGNIYGSMEAKIIDSKEHNSLISALVEIAEWFKKEGPMIEDMKHHDEMMDAALLNPDDEHATELGEVPHEEEKGSILQKNLFAPYLYGRYTY